ncbi:MAG: cytochrome c oxidase, subunit [Chloroflexi bacterium]|nr:cytochrome c oxidase, subunit [Chloroflexota bacterium]
MTAQNSLRPRLLILCWLLLLTASLSGCTAFADRTAPQSTVFPLSDWGRSIQDLYSLVFLMSIPVFIGVEGFIVYAVVRFRRRASDELPNQVHGNTRLEVAWTVIPSIVLLIIAIPTISAIFYSDAPPASAQNVLKVTVIGHQWWWEFHYPDLGVSTANELHLPAGRTASFELKSADVIHSFWVPRMGGKVDVVPTRANHMWFTPDANAVGVYPGQCVEFCGIQHANMRLDLVVDTPSDFEAWTQRQKANAVQPTGGAEQQGAAAFMDATRGLCFSCHAIRGTEAKGTIGPDLTHVGSRRMIAAGILENTPANMQKWIQHSQDIKPGSKMGRPVGNGFQNLAVTDADAAAIAAYVFSLK